MYGYAEAWVCVPWILIVFAEWNCISLDSRYMNAFKFCSPVIKCHEQFFKILILFLLQEMHLLPGYIWGNSKQNLKILLSTLVSYYVLTAVVL